MGLSENQIEMIEACIAAIDNRITTQLLKVIYHEKFLKLEGSWRGLLHLVSHSLTGPSLKITICDVRKKELLSALKRMRESLVFNGYIFYPFETAGGNPFSALVVDFQFADGECDLNALERLAQLGAATFCPVLTSASPNFFGMQCWSDLYDSVSTEQLLTRVESQNSPIWNRIRGNGNGRFVYLALPRSIARSPYDTVQERASEYTLSYKELPNESDKVPLELNGDEFCYMNSAYVLAQQIAELHCGSAFASNREIDLAGPSKTSLLLEIVLDDQIKFKLSSYGFAPLFPYKKLGLYGAVTSLRSIHNTQASGGGRVSHSADDAEVASQLNVITTVARFAHCAKQIVMNWDLTLGITELQVSLDWWLRSLAREQGNSLEAKQDVEIEKATESPSCFDVVVSLAPIFFGDSLKDSIQFAIEVKDHRGFEK